jgi:hypothetical protein
MLNVIERMEMMGKKDSRQMEIESNAKFKHNRS